MTVSDYDWSLSNAGPHRLVVWIEPWAEEFEIPVRSTVALKGSGEIGARGVGEVEWVSDHVTVWATTRTLEVFIDGVLQDSASAIVPLPGGLDKDMLTVLFGRQPSARLGGTESVTVDQGSWWRRLWRQFRAN